MATLYDVDNVVVGPAALWLQPWVAATPPELPEDTQVLFETYPSPWVGAGGTDEGFTVNFDSSTQDITIEEQSTPVFRSIESKTVTIAASLAEDTIQSMQWAYGGTTTVTAPGTGQPGKTVLTLSDDLAIFAAVLEAKNSFGMARRLFIPKVVVAGSVETAYRRAANKRMYPITLSSICATGDISITEITAEATP